MGEVQDLAIDVSLSGRKRLASWLEPTGNRNDLCVLDDTLQHGVWCTPLRDCNLHTGAIDLFGACRGCAWACDIAVIHLHESRAESEVLGASGIARSKPDLPVIGRKAFVVARGIVVRLELDRDTQMRGKSARNHDGDAAESSVRQPGHQNGVGCNKSGAQFAGWSQYSDGRFGLRPWFSLR